MAASSRSSSWSRRAAAAPILIVLFWFTPAPCWAQASSRAEEIEAARRKKAAELRPEKLTAAETRLNKIVETHMIERIATGFHGLTLVWGGLPVGQGFALGPQYSKPALAGGALKLRTSARATTAKGLLFDFQLTAPKLANEVVFFDVYAAHRNLSQVDYYGQGPDSSLDDESQYRLEDTSFDFTLGFRPFRYKFSRPFSLGVTGGYLLANTGPGNEDELQAQDHFGPDTTPGLFDQTSFLRGGFFANYDYRDNPGGPRRGGFYGAKFLYYDDREISARNHRRLDLEVQQYIPFWNERRVIALRVASTMTFASGADGSVPFYLQPSVGGSRDLRGFRAYRFYDNNAIIANAEYRFETFTGLDMALFFDAGKVASKRSQINFHDLEASAGFGFRFNVANSVFLRLDVGFSHEGTHMWLTFDNVF